MYSPCTERPPPSQIEPDVVQRPRPEQEVVYTHFEGVIEPSDG